MKFIHRNNDVIQGKKDLEDLYCFKNFPVYMGVSNNDSKHDLLVDMNWQISRSSGAVQLNPLLPLDVVYKEEHGSGTVGKLWNEHHKNFAEFINKFKPSKVLEIGGLHGILSKFYLEIDKETEWTIVEPNPILAKDVKAKIIKGYFNENFKFEKEIDTIVHSHVLEHIYDIQEFLAHISKFLIEGNKLIFSVPNLEKMISLNYTNTVNFEHTILLTEPYIKYLLNKFNFRIVEKEYFKDDHSIFYSCIKDIAKKDNASLEKLYDHNKSIFLKYINYHKKLINEINIKIENKKKKSNLYLFGAHIFSQYLINFGLNINDIKCILDNDRNKQGKRLYGTNLKVFSPIILKEEEQPTVILKAGVYTNEIKDDIIRNINSQTIFL